MRAEVSISLIIGEGCKIGVKFLATRLEFSPRFLEHQIISLSTAFLCIWYKCIMNKRNNIRVSLPHHACYVRHKLGQFSSFSFQSPHYAFGCNFQMDAVLTMSISFSL